MDLEDLVVVELVNSNVEVARYFDSKFRAKLVAIVDERNKLWGFRGYSQKYFKIGESRADSAYEEDRNSTYDGVLGVYGPFNDEQFRHLKNIVSAVSKVTRDIQSNCLD